MTETLSRPVAPSAGLQHVDVDVVVVGGGPSGLTAAAALAPRVAGTVMVLEREAAAGGIPRHSDHPGYGIRDLHRFISGPRYARRLVRSAHEAGAVLRCGATVTGWAGEHALEVTSPEGRQVVRARAVVLATGARERPRPARLVPGDRGAGVFTTGHLQNLVHLHHQEVGRRAVIIGAELVSWSAVVTLREAGCTPVLMVSEHPSPESYAAFNVPGRLALRVPVVTRTRLRRIVGKPRVEAVELEDMTTGAVRRVECDTVVLTGDWIPDHELARWTGLEMDRGTRGPVVDTTLRTSRPGVFAVGNLLHAVDTADVAALDGAHVAAPVLRWLAGRGGQVGPACEVVAGEPFRWVSPQRLRPDDGAPPRGRLLLWADRLIRLPRVEVVQDGRVVAHRVLPWPASPGRVFRVPWSVLAGVDLGAGPVVVRAVETAPWRRRPR